MEPQHDQERLDKLPKHAREEIILLRSNVAHLERKLSVGPADSNAFLDPYGRAPRPLGNNPMIKFATGEEDELEGFHVQFVDGELRIQGMAPRYDDYLAVLPMSGNYVAIRHVRKGN